MTSLPGIGVFGTGLVLKVLVPILREKGFKVMAIWGRTIQDAERAAKDMAIPFFTNKIDDVLLRKDVDLVFIICPPFLHSQISVKALGIGKHVVCDRPMGLSQSDALKMVRASQYYPTLIALVNHSLRFLPAFVKMKESLTSAALGDVSLIDIRIQMGLLLHEKYDWLCDATMGGGVLNLIGSHVVDLVTFLTGKRAIRVHGIVRTYTTHNDNVKGIRRISAPDFCNFQMELDGGILVTVFIQSNATTCQFSEEVMVCGSSGQLVARNSELFSLRLLDDQPYETCILSEGKQVVHETETMLPNLYINGMNEMVFALREAFNNQTQNYGWEKRPVQMAATFDDGLYVQAVLEALLKSSENRCWEKVVVISEYAVSQQKIVNEARMHGVLLT